MGNRYPVARPICPHVGGLTNSERTREEKNSGSGTGYDTTTSGSGTGGEAHRRSGNKIAVACKLTVSFFVSLRRIRYGDPSSVVARIEEVEFVENTDQVASFSRGTLQDPMRAPQSGSRKVTAKTVYRRLRTAMVDEDFSSRMVAQNADLPALRNGLIFAQPTSARAVSEQAYEESARVSNRLSRIKTRAPAVPRTRTSPRSRPKRNGRRKLRRPNSNGRNPAPSRSGSGEPLTRNL